MLVLPVLMILRFMVAIESVKIDVWVLGMRTPVESLPINLDKATFLDCVTFLLIQSFDQDWVFYMKYLCRI